MTKSRVDEETLQIESHAWRIWLESGDAIVCRRCGNPFVPSGRRRGRDGKEMTRESGESGREDGQAVDLCGACLPLRLLKLGDRRARRPECEVCGASISGRRSDVRFCGPSCKKQSYRLRKRGNAGTVPDDDETEDSGDDIGFDAKGGHPMQEEASAT